MIGPTVHPSLSEVLIQFRSHHIAMIADVSQMYRSVLLAEPDKDLYHFFWRDDPKEPLTDYRMTRITFGVSASSFIANMCVKKNAIEMDLSKEVRTQSSQPTPSIQSICREGGFGIS